MSSPSPLQSYTYQNPPTVAIVDTFKNDATSPLTESESLASSNPLLSDENEIEASTADHSWL